MKERRYAPLAVHDISQPCGQEDRMHLIVCDELTSPFIPCIFSPSSPVYPVA
jgi:hypothetical protein